MTSPVLLCLDLGAIIGWAPQNKDSAISSGITMFRPQRFRGGMRYIWFNNFLDEILFLPSKIDAAYFKEVSASKKQVIDAVKRSDFKPEDDNEADALDLLRFAAKQLL